jgi:hypothetical protein
MADERTIDAGTLTLTAAGPDQDKNRLEVREFYASTCEVLRACGYDPVTVIAGLAATITILMAQAEPAHFDEMLEELLTSIRADTQGAHRLVWPTGRPM